MNDKKFIISELQLMLGLLKPYYEKSPYRVPGQLNIGAMQEIVDIMPSLIQHIIKIVESLPDGELNNE